MAATDADALVVAALQQSGCLPKAMAVATATDSPLRDLDCDALVAIVSMGLARLQQGADAQLPLAVPPAPVGVAARHRVGSQLASAVKALGYAGDCGYNHFLYPSEKETRSLLTWLVSKLPRAAVEDSSGEDAAVAAAAATGGESRGFEADAATFASPSALLAPERLQGIFAAWTRERTLFVLPNRELPNLRGFQSLRLKTSAVQLPWLRESKDESGFLFDDFPTSSLRPASLLEALASNQRRSSQQMSLFDDDDDEAATAKRRTAHEARFIGTSDEAPPTAARDTPEATFTSQADSDGENELGVEGAAASSLGEFDFLPSVEALSSGVSGPPLVVASSSLPSLDDRGALGSDLHMPATNVDVANSESVVSEIKALTEAAEQELLEHMHTQTADAQQRIAKMRKVVERERRELETMQTQIEASKKRGLELKRDLAKRQQLIVMLPQAKENIAKLENMCATNSSRLKELEVEWEAHRAPLVKEEARLVAMKSTRKARCRQFVAEMKSFRQEMKDMAGTIRHKMDAMRILDRTYAQLPQHLNRSMYTARIMEIIKQVHKQKAEIAKIIDDIKAIQKQLNLASEKLKRSEAVTEDKLYTAASNAVAGGGNKESPFVECYRKFAEVRELFEELLLVVGDVGKKENAARDLENWISQLQNRDSGRHLDRVLADLESVQAENMALAEQLRAQKA